MHYLLDPNDLTPEIRRLAIPPGITYYEDQEGDVLAHIETVNTAAAIDAVALQDDVTHDILMGYTHLPNYDPNNPPE